MVSIFLTQSGGLLGPIASLLGVIMNAIFEACSSLGVENIGLCIILFTVAINLLMLPLTINQQKFSKMTAVMTPEIQKITEKYKDKKDQDSLLKQQAEQRAVYEKYGVSPTSGCLPLLIQMPILFALYKVIYNVPAYVQGVKDVFMDIVDVLLVQNDFADKLAEIAASVNFKNLDVQTKNTIVDLLYKLDENGWQQLEEAFPHVATTVQPLIDRVTDMNMFFGINLANSPGFRPNIAWIVPILAGLSQWYSTRLMTSNQNIDSDNPMAASMKGMNTFMPLFSVFICITIPAGVGLYWVASSVVRVVMQIFINRYMDQLDMNDIMQKNIEKKNKKRAKKGLPPIRTSANLNTRANSGRTIGEIEAEAKKKQELPKPSQKEDSTKYYESRGVKPGSIAAKARMVKDYDEKNLKKK